MSTPEMSRASSDIRPQSAVDLALFRILQESLTKVRWHSGSQKAVVSVSLTEREVVLRVRDYGKGMSQGHAAEVTT